MFRIEKIDPKIFRQKTRKASFIIIAIFVTFALPLSYFTQIFFSNFSINPYLLNFSGALLGLFITFWIVKVFFADKEWMKEAMYSWQLKRSLARLYNIVETLKEKAHNKDIQAMKLLRFYHLALEQMYNLENNNHASIELIAEKQELIENMQQLNLDLNQITFDKKLINNYKNS